MQQVEQLIENNNSVAFKLSKYERVIHTLTNRISMHHKKKSGMTIDSPFYDIYRKKVYEWRRISFALHRKRSELKSRKEVLSKNMEPASQT
jgi:hypothetical protein